MLAKNQIVILVVVVVLIFGGIIGWAVLQKEKISTGEKVTPEEEEVIEEVFSLSAKVLSVDAANNSLMVKPTKEEKEIKVVVSETTKLIKLEFPFDPKNPPKEATFTPIQTEIEVSDFQVDDTIFIKSKENIAGKSVISNIDFVHILP